MKNTQFLVTMKFLNCQNANSNIIRHKYSKRGIENIFLNNKTAFYHNASTQYYTDSASGAKNVMKC